uniref:bifunctional diguanylate cyclase/phosphodiesterase n=1 Tax=Ningiella ruwaisensis TaxID=2364274 RepID=UPI00109FFEBB|nr:EAL domain-containing protein [Ningiella ruwaisensis]
MRQPTLQRYVLTMVIGLLAFSSVAIMTNVWISSSKSGKSQILDALSVGENVLLSSFQNREDLLINSAQVLTDDFGFKQAVATGDQRTIESTLENHGARIQADVMALISLEGSLIASTQTTTSDKTRTLISNSHIQEALTFGGTTLWLLTESGLYQSILLTVDAPTPIALALVGFKVDQSLLSSFDEVTQLHTSINIQTMGNGPFVLSTLPQAHIEDALSSDSHSLTWLSLNRAKYRYISNSIQLGSIDDSPVIITLSADVNKVFKEFKRLQTSIFTIGVATVFLALLFGLLMSKRLSTPIAQLVQMAQKIASGSYEAFSLNAKGVKEVNILAKSFDTMQRNIQSREQKIRYQAQHDLVTGLYNRVYLSEHVQSLVKAQTFQVIGMSLRGFRQLNDTFGHENGDLCLKQIAERCQLENALCARISGNEFMLVLRKPLSQTGLEEFQAHLQAPISSNDISILPKVTLVTLSVPEDAASVEQIFRRVNITLDQANSLNLPNLAFNREFEEKYDRRLAIIRELKQALNHNNDELSMVYQPKMCLKKNGISKVEALIRWNSEKLGFVPPDEFIEIAEQANLIYALTRYVIQRVIFDVSDMRAKGHELCAAINLSAKDIMHAELLPWILMQLDKANLNHDALSFEITESDIVTDPQKAASQLLEYRRCGFDIAIDDFGTGYSSLAYLQTLPVSSLKIDKSFVLKLASNNNDKKIVQSIIALAKSFDLKVVAEGIEDETSLALLKQYECDWAQGYFICRPVPPDALISFLTEHTSSEYA